MCAGIPAALVDADGQQRAVLLAAGTKARATLDALDPAARRALRMFLDDLGSEQEVVQGRRALSSTQRWRPAAEGSAQARANTHAPQAQEHDWVCPGCKGYMHGRHRACQDCRVDREGIGVRADLCPWRCGQCGHINPAKEQACRGKPGMGCGHHRSIVGGLGVEFMGNDWVCGRCRELGQQLVRMWVGRTECRRCYTTLAEMRDTVTYVRNYPEGTLFE